MATKANAVLSKIRELNEGQTLKTVNFTSLDEFRQTAIDTGYDVLQERRIDGKATASKDGKIMGVYDNAIHSGWLNIGTNNGN